MDLLSSNAQTSQLNEEKVFSNVAIRHRHGGQEEIWRDKKPYKTTKNHKKPQKTIQNHTKPHKTIQNVIQIHETLTIECSYIHTHLLKSTWRFLLRTVLFACCRTSMNRPKLSKSPSWAGDRPGSSKGLPHGKNPPKHLLIFINLKRDEKNNQSINQSMEQSINQSIDQSIHNRIDNQINQSIDGHHTGNQWTNGSNQSINQSIGKAIRKTYTTDIFKLFQQLLFLVFGATRIQSTGFIRGNQISPVRIRRNAWEKRKIPRSRPMKCVEVTKMPVLRGQ